MRHGCLTAARLTAIVAGLALLAPRLFAHGNEYLFARLSINPDGEVVLELTADIANPLFTDEEHARTVLAEALRLRRADGFKRLDDISPLRFEHRDRYSADSPMTSATDTGPHHLLTAIWHASLPGQSLIFATPERTPHDVVLWQVPPAGQSAEWKLLICGEQCTAIAVPARRSSAMSTYAYWLGAAVAALALSVVGWQVARTTRAGLAATGPRQPSSP